VEPRWTRCARGPSTTSPSPSTGRACRACCCTSPARRPWRELSELRDEPDLGHFGLVGRSAPMQQVYDMIGKVAPARHGARHRRAAPAGLWRARCTSCLRARPALRGRELRRHLRQPDRAGCSDTKGSFTSAEQRHRGSSSRPTAARCSWTRSRRCRSSSR
jgi:hypothetical protein